MQMFKAIYYVNVNLVIFNKMDNAHYVNFLALHVLHPHFVLLVSLMKIQGAVQKQVVNAFLDILKVINLYAPYAILLDASTVPIKLFARYVRIILIL